MLTMELNMYLKMMDGRIDRCGYRRRDFRMEGVSGGGYGVKRGCNVGFHNRVCHRRANSWVVHQSENGLMGITAFAP